MGQCGNDASTPRVLGLAPGPPCSMLSMNDTRRRRALRRLRLYAALAILVCLFFVTYGAFVAWDSYHRLPRVYASLRARGVPATANLVRCAPGIGIYHGVRCRLSLRFDGRHRTWDYPEDSAQFKGLAVGAAIPVLVDPNSSSTVYTVHDVEQRTNAGTSVVFWYGVGLVVFGLAGFAGLLWLRRPTMPRPAGPTAGPTS
jgi:hypothetical protein